MPAQHHVLDHSLFAGAYKTGGYLSSADSCTLNAVHRLTELTIQNCIVENIAGLDSMIESL
jgi:hypothetical protein